MVQDVTFVRAEKADSPSNPVFFRTYGVEIRECKETKETWLQLINCRLLSSVVGNKVYELTNQKLNLLLKYRHKLLRIDDRVENIVRPLEEYSGGIVFEDLGEQSFLVDGANRKLIFNLQAVNRVAQKIPEEWLHIALLVFIFHEISHISQKIKLYEDVQRMKVVDQDYGREQLLALDLHSDFLAIHTLSLLLTLYSEKEYNRKIYINWLYGIWRHVCGQMLDVFPSEEREDKQRRIFGALLMSNSIRDAYLSNYPLEFEAELLPKWSKSLDRLSIYSDGSPLIPCCSVDQKLMAQALNAISQRKYDVASFAIEKIWRTLPRR